MPQASNFELRYYPRLLNTNATCYMVATSVFLLIPKDWKEK